MCNPLTQIMACHAKRESNNFAVWHFSTADIIQNKYIYNKNADDVTWTRTQGIFQVIVTSLDNIILTIGQYPSF